MHWKRAERLHRVELRRNADGHPVSVMKGVELELQMRAPSDTMDNVTDHAVRICDCQPRYRPAPSRSPPTRSRAVRRRTIYSGCT